MSDVAALRAEAVRHYRAHHFAQAAEAAFAYLEARPNDRPILQLLADATLGDGQLDVAERVFGYLMADERTAFDVSGLANVLIARGKMAEADVLVHEALRLDPTLPRAWSLAAGIHRFTRKDPLIDRARRQFARPGTPPAARRAMAYCLSKAMNDQKKWDHAWHWAAKGAAIDLPAYDPADLDAWADDMVPTFDRDFLGPRQGRGDPTAAPIFIVGMPRSGTTLVESIIAAAGQAHPMGELSTIPMLAEQAIHADLALGNPHDKHAWIRRWRDQAFAQAAALYLADIRRRGGGTLPDRFVDKLPGNIFYLGLIACMFPRARIIRMHRDPLDTCVSCWLGQFAEGHQYTRRLDWLGRAWRTFQRAGDFIAPLIPNPVLDVDYETLVATPDDETRRIADFLGIDWSPDCLAPGGAGYATTTRSVAEVRAPINARSVGRWRRYARHLGPLAQALQVELS